jgi:large repetitive protein
VTVTTSEGTSGTSSVDRFRYLPAVSAVSPTSGPVGGGTTVTISGAGYIGTTAVEFGSTAASSFTVNSESSITAISPAALAGTVDVSVTGPQGASPISSKDHFQFTPTITGLSPHSGPEAGGTSVIVSGSGFAPGAIATIFRFGTAPATSVNCSSTTECTTVSPAHAKGTVAVKATVNKATSSKNIADEFTYG